MTEPNLQDQPAPLRRETPISLDQKLRRDLHATVGAREELGERYETELVDSFLGRLDHSIDDRIEQLLKRRPAATAKQRRRGPGKLGLLAVALLLLLPLFAFSASFGAFVGLAVGFGSEPHHVLLGLISAGLVTIGSFAFGSLLLAVGAVIYLDRRRA